MFNAFIFVLGLITSAPHHKYPPVEFVVVTPKVEHRV